MTMHREYDSFKESSVSSAMPGLAIPSCRSPFPPSALFLALFLAPVNQLKAENLQKRETDFFAVFAKDTLAGISAAVKDSSNEKEIHVREYTELDLSRIGSTGKFSFSSETVINGKGEISSYNSTGTTSRGKIRNNVTAENGRITASTIMDDGKERKTHLPMRESIRWILDNNLYQQIFNLFDTGRQKISRADSDISEQSFMPPFMKMKDVKISKLNERTFSMNFGGQVALGFSSKNEKTSTVTFPMQAIQISKLPLHEFIFANATLKALPAPMSPALPWKTGPDRITAIATVETPLPLDLMSLTGYAHFGKISNHEITGTWTNSKNQKIELCEWPKQTLNSKLTRAINKVTIDKCGPMALSGLPRVLLDASNIISRESNFTLWNLSVETAAAATSAAISSGYEAITVTGICLLGKGDNRDSVVPIQFSLIRPGPDTPRTSMAENGKWQVLDPIFGLNSDRYIALGRIQTNPPILNSIKIVWQTGKADSSAVILMRNETQNENWKAGYIFLKRLPLSREIALFIHTLKGKNTLVGTSGYRIERKLDIAKGLDRLIADSAMFQSFGEMRSKKSSGKTDGYSHSLIQRTTTSLDPFGRPADIKGKMRTLNTGDITLTGTAESQGPSASEKNCFTTTLARENEKPVVLSSRGNEAIVSPMDPGHWRVLFSCLQENNLKADHIRLKTVNPFSDGKGYAVDLDLFFADAKARNNTPLREVRCPLYSLMFHLDPEGKIVFIENHRTRIISSPCSEQEYLDASRQLSGQVDNNKNRDIFSN